MYMFIARPTCLLLDRQEVWRAFSRACAKTGKRMAARIAIMAMTTSSSMSVKPLRTFIDEPPNEISTDDCVAFPLSRYYGSAEDDQKSIAINRDDTGRLTGVPILSA